MSSTPKKPLQGNTMSSGATGRRPSTNPPRSSSPISRGPSPSKVLSTNGIASTPSTRAPTGVTRPGRASVRRPGQSTGSLSISNIHNPDDTRDEDVRAENATLIDNLKKSLRNAELVSEDYQREIQALQKQLEEVLKEQSKLEERLHESTGKIENLESEKKEFSRQFREMGSLYESERMSMLRDREEQTSKATELKSTIQRLKETIAGREMRVNADAERRMSRSGRTHSRSSSVDANGRFAPPSSIQRRGSSLQRDGSQSNARVFVQKDMMIESLRLELAEAQIKLVEMENMGGDRMQELEKTLLETRMTNARLMEDNESFQLLLGEKTLNGDFSKADFMQGTSTTNESSGLGSLAEELESADPESENYRRVEAECKSLKDQNRALTLYIEKIISRVLMHENFETILDQKSESSATSKSVAANTEKDLPPPPLAKDDAAPQSVLQRAMSVVGGPRRQRPQSVMMKSAPVIPGEEISQKSRPQSQILAPAPAQQPINNEDPFSAPRIPLSRTLSISRGAGHRRSQSEKTDIAQAAAVVNHMYRGPSAGAGTPAAPPSPGGTTARTSYFAPAAIVGSTGSTGVLTPASNTPSNLAPAGQRATSRSRAPSSNQGTNDRIGSSSNSTFSRSSGEVPSPPRNTAGSTTYTGAVMTQSKLRPLRLVQENRELESVTTARKVTVNVDDEAARKKVNRGSWMGWFNRGKDEATPRSMSGDGGPL